jgi:predicted membrane protein
VAAVAALLAIGNGLLHWQAVDRVWRDFQIQEHTSVIAGTYVAPVQYRILTYALAEGLVRLGLPIHSAHEVWRVIFTALSLFVFYNYLRAWFSPVLALLGMCLLGAIIPLTYVYYMMAVSDPLNMLVFFLGFWAIRERRDRWLIPLVGIGMLNRETPILLPLFYAAVRWGEPFRRWLPLFAATSCVAVGVYLALHFVYQPVCCDYGLLEAILVNLTDWRAYLGAIVVFNIGLWGTWIGWRRRPEFLRRLSLMVPVFVVPYLFQGTVRESRYWLPLLAIVIPMVLLYLVDLLRDEPISTTGTASVRESRPMIVTPTTQARVPQRS